MAEKFADFMTSRKAQQFMASDLGRRSVRKDVEASELVIPKYKINNLPVNKKTVIACKDSWIEEFEKIYKEGTDG